MERRLVDIWREQNKDRCTSCALEKKASYLCDCKDCSCINFMNKESKWRPKSCGNCANFAISVFEEPCKGCCSFLDKEHPELYTRWEPNKDLAFDQDMSIEEFDKHLSQFLENNLKYLLQKGILDDISVEDGPLKPQFKKENKEKGCVTYPDTVFKTENNRKIDRINERVDSIQHNVFVYGNDIVNKIIAIQDKIGMTPDAEIYLKDIRQDLCDLDTKLDGIEAMLKDIQKTLNDQPVIGDIHRVESKLDDLDIKQVVFDDPFITLTKEENAERPTPKFKDGDTVKYKTGQVRYIVSNVKKLNTGYCYDLERRFPYAKRNYKITGVLESRLEEVKK